MNHGMITRTPRVRGKLIHMPPILAGLQADLTKRWGGVIVGRMEFNGQALTDAREAKSMSRELLAGLVGVSVQTIVNAEEGKHQPKGEHAAAMAHHLDISLDDLYRKNGAAA